MAVAEPAANSDSAGAQQPADPEAGPKLGLVRQLVRFLLIGGGCAIIDFGTYSLLLGVVGWPFWISKSISFILGTTTSYVINRKFTFQAANTGNTKAKAGAFGILYTITFFVNMGTNQALVVGFGAEGDPALITVFWIIAQGLGTLVNFIMLKLLVFRE